MLSLKGHFNFLNISQHSAFLKVYMCIYKIFDFNGSFKGVKVKLNMHFIICLVMFEIQG